jgi:hypothetical protein
MKLALKDFQLDAVDRLVAHVRRAMREATSSEQAIVLASPTGSGKTIMATAMIERLIEGDGIVERRARLSPRGALRLDVQHRTPGHVQAGRVAVLEKSPVFYANLQRLLVHGVREVTTCDRPRQCVELWEIRVPFFPLPTEENPSRRSCASCF